MRILVIGGLGSVGGRYVAILKYFGHEPVVYDLNNPDCGVEYPNDDWEKAIVATPTDTHYYYCKKLIAKGKPFLVEKPMSKNLKECQELVDLDTNKLGHVVCNYKYMLNAKENSLMYDYYKTGNDGLYWDLAQLIYLHPGMIIKTDSPFWKFENYGRNIPYFSLEQSYMEMIGNFVEGKYEELWSLQQGLDMTIAVIERMGKA